MTLKHNREYLMKVGMWSDPRRMKRKRILRIPIISRLIGLAITLVVASAIAPTSSAQAPAKPSATAQLEVNAGTKVSYRVAEELVGLNFLGDAEGTTEAIKGALVLHPDGSIDSANSKVTVDLRTLKSDQDMRDSYIKGRTLETNKFPIAEFVARKLKGVPFPLPAPEQSGGQSHFQLVGDLTVHGVTKQVTLEGYAYFGRDMITGWANTSFTFATFHLTKPTVAHLLTVYDEIQLDIEFGLKRN